MGIIFLIRWIGGIIISIIEIILSSAEAAFLEVGVFVGAVLLLFGYINYKKSGSFIATIEGSKKWQPVIGALLGLTPGCGGAIFIMPLYFKKAVSFGTVVATLIATMGDSSFVIIASHPLQYFMISAISFVVAIITGYVVDMTSLGEKLLEDYNRRRASKEALREKHSKIDHGKQHQIIHKMHSVDDGLISHIGHLEGDDIDLYLHHNLKGHQELGTFSYHFTHKGSYFYWGFIFVGLILGIMLLFQMDVNTLTIPNLGFIIGVIGTVFSITMMIMSKKFLQDDTHEEAELKAMSLKETFIHNAQDTAFVVTWVFVGFLAYELLVLSIGGGNYLAGEQLIEGALLTTGILSIIIGASVGLIPGCGPQIIFVALFTRGLVPFAALFANAVSQDGDALMPLLAIDRPSALWATIITTIPAIAFGLIIYWLEFNTVFGSIFHTSLEYLKALL